MTGPREAILCICLCFAVSQLAHGAAYFDALIKEDSGYGKVVKYCEYNNLKVGVGSRIKDMDACMKCTCTKHGLGCADMGFGVGGYPSDSLCINVVAGCKNRWVYRDNQSVRCPKRDRPDNVYMVGK